MNLLTVAGALYCSPFCSLLSKSPYPSRCLLWLSVSFRRKITRNFPQSRTMGTVASFPISQRAGKPPEPRTCGSKEEMLSKATIKYNKVKGVCVCVGGICISCLFGPLLMLGQPKGVLLEPSPPPFRRASQSSLGFSRNHSSAVGGRCVCVSQFAKHTQEI